MSIRSAVAALAGGETIVIAEGPAKLILIKEKLNITASAFTTLSQTIPPGGRVLSTYMSYGSALANIDLTHGTFTDSAGTGGIALTIVAPTSLATNSTTSHFAYGGSTTAANSKFATTPEILGTLASVYFNNATVGATIYAFPYVSATNTGAVRTISVNTTATSAGYSFTGTNDCYVNILVAVNPVPVSV